MKKEPDKFNEKLKGIKEKINDLDKPAPKYHYGHLTVILIAAISIAGVMLAITGTSYTGNVVFSEDTTTNTGTSFIARNMQIKELEPPKNAQAVMLSGTVKGTGKAEVYLISGGEKKLAYYFEGNAGEGEEFRDACYGTCYTKMEPNATLLFKIKGVTLRIDNIKYTASRLIGFEMEPKEVDIDYKKEPVKTFDIKVTNPEHKEFNLFLYIDGPLADSFSWQGSIIKMTAEKEEETVHVEVRLPDNLAPGEYVQKITARYMPPSYKVFRGSTPTEEMIVKVKN